MTEAVLLGADWHMPAYRFHDTRAPSHDWLHDALVEAYGMDRETWSVGIVEGVMARLHKVLPPSVRLTPVVLWLRPLTAFTTPGHYVYVSRRLLERPLSDDAVALELGHVELFQGWLRHLPRGIPGTILAAAYRLAERRVYGPERELAADARGLELCLAAGYEGRLCLRLFDILSADAEDRGDLAGAFGPDEEIDPLIADKLYAKASVWLWERLRGYPSLRRRHELLRARLSKHP